MDDNELLGKWMEATSEREKAILEQELWRAVQKPGIERRRYLTSLLGAQPSIIDSRTYLLNHDKDVGELWRRIEDKTMTYHTACRLMRQAKMACGVFPIELGKVLAEYDAIPTTVTSKSGIRTRRIFRGRKSKISSKTFWKNLRRDVEIILTQESVGLDPPTAKDLKVFVLSDLEIFIRSSQTKISKARSKIVGAESVERLLRSGREIDQACETLRIDRPKVIDDVFMKRALAQKRALVRVFHPDTGGVAADQSKYTAVIDAYDILDEARSETTNGDSK